MPRMPTDCFFYSSASATLQLSSCSQGWQQYPVIRGIERSGSPAVAWRKWSGPVHGRSQVAFALLLKRRHNDKPNAGDHMAAQQQPLEEVIRRVQGEYIEMPGLRLTTAQAQRLWGLDRLACDTLLGALVDAKFLFRTRDGAFVRSDQAARS